MRTHVQSQSLLLTLLLAGLVSAFVGINHASAERVTQTGAVEGIREWSLMLSNLDGKYDDADSGTVDPRTLKPIDEQIISDHPVVVARGETAEGEARAVSAVFAPHPAHGRWYPLWTTDRADDGKGWADVYEMPDGRVVVAFADVPHGGVGTDRTVASDDLRHIGLTLPRGSGISDVSRDGGRS